MDYPQDYGDDVGDKNIDFRRVRNLNVFFLYHAKVLTTDISDISQWQGGDIVVFPSLSVPPLLTIAFWSTSL